MQAGLSGCPLNMDDDITAWLFPILQLLIGIQFFMKLHLKKDLEYEQKLPCSESMLLAKKERKTKQNGF